MTNKIYLTHCSAKKDDSLRGTKTAVPPDALYVATPTQLFIDRCKSAGVRWAIFSDKHGVFWPEAEHGWYDKHPNSVTESEFRALVNNFDTELEDFDEIFFYANPGRFHPLYKRLLHESKMRDRIRMVTHLHEIA